MNRSNRPMQQTPLRARPRPPGLHAERAKAEGMLEAARQLEHMVQMLHQEVSTLASSSEDIREATLVQRQRIHETATAMEEMNSTVLEVAKTPRMPPPRVRMRGTRPIRAQRSWGGRLRPCAPRSRRLLNCAKPWAIWINRAHGIGRDHDHH